MRHRISSTLRAWWMMLPIFVLAAVLRLWRIAEYPVGMHADEGWFGYNAWLLLKQGVNVYGERWPLSVDMFGDTVSALHSYFTIPAVWAFGLSTFSIRLTMAVFSLMTLVVLTVFAYRLFRSRSLALLTALFYALSPWNILMTRASSTIIMDMFWLFAFLLAFLVWLEWLAHEQLDAPRQRLVAFATGGATYALATTAYFTYFTSRLLIIPLAICLLLLVVWRMRPRRSVITMGLLPIIAYGVFPFLIMLNTPFAQGRFQQTTVINSPVVQIALFENISRSGQAGLPVLPTRALYNKVTVNATELLRHYITLFSPTVLLFHTAPPARYHIPNTSVVTPIEYIGVLAAIGIVLIGGRSVGGGDQRPAAIWVIAGLLVAAVPSGLTIDDHPNLQRAVIMMPFIALAAAAGWSEIFQHLHVLPRYLRRTLGTARAQILGVVFLSSPFVIAFFIGMMIHARYDDPYFRNRATQQMALWMNAHAVERKLLVENRESIFMFPFFYGKRNILDEQIVKDGKYYTGNFSIGKWNFYQDLCRSDHLLLEDYDYAVVYVFQHDCPRPWWMQKVYTAVYDDGMAGFEAWQPDVSQQQRYRELLHHATGELEQGQILAEAYAESSPSGELKN